MDEDTARFVAAIRTEADEKGGSLGAVLRREADRIAAGHMSAFDEWAKGRFLEREQGKGS